MTPLFADAFYYLALLNSGDAAHARAAVFSRRIRCRIVTTQWVLTEVADALNHRSARTKVGNLMSLLKSNRFVTVVPASSELFQRGLDLYLARTDKDWSLTDCTSFIVMQDFRLTAALTGDHHFEQAGFNALLK